MLDGGEDDVPANPRVVTCITEMMKSNPTAGAAADDYWARGSPVAEERVGQGAATLLYLSGTTGMSNAEATSSTLVSKGWLRTGRLAAAPTAMAWQTSWLQHLQRIPHHLVVEFGIVVEHVVRIHIQGPRAPIRNSNTKSGFASADIWKEGSAAMQRALAGRLLRKLPTNGKAARLVTSLHHHPVGSFPYSTDRFLDVGQPSFISHPQLLKEGEVTPGITENEYASRRKRLLEALPDNSLAIIASAPVKMMTDVVPYPFRQDADYLYLTGCLQPGGIATLSKDSGFCMFMPDPDPQDVVWQGEIAGVEAALEIFKADRACQMHKMNEILQGMIGRASRLFHNVKTALPAYTKMEAFRIAMQNVSAANHVVFEDIPRREQVVSQS